MYQTLFVPELFRYTFGDSDNADLAALARTCKGFKEPALDLLWQKLDNLSPLVRCLPEASRMSIYLIAYCYSFNRALSEAEQNTLRSYARRVHVIRELKDSEHFFLEKSAIRIIFNLAPLTDPLFPNLRTLYWQHSTEFPALHFAVPSLTSLYLDLRYSSSLPLDIKFFDIFGDRCPNMKELVVRGSCRVEADVTISRQVCCWPSLLFVYCPHVALNLDAIKHLSSAPSLRRLLFTAETDTIEAVSHIGSKLVFSSLADLRILSKSLDTVTLLLSHIQLPATKGLIATFSNHASKQVIHAFWAAAREASPSIVSIRLGIAAYRGINRIPTYARLMLEDLLPCTAFSTLRSLHVNLGRHVSLTDADLFRLVSPTMEKIVINDVSGWGMRRDRDGGGITLTGLVQLLRRCPSLYQLSLAIDTSTFVEIPEGLDVSFPPRNGLKFDFVDSYLPPDFVTGVVSVFIALKIGTSMFRVWHTRVVGELDALQP